MALCSLLMHPYTNDLCWDDIKFETDEEKQGAMELQSELKSQHKLTNVPPFEMARFYLGSKGSNVNV